MALKDLGDQFKAVSNLGNDLRDVSKEVMTVALTESQNIQQLAIECTREFKQEAALTRKIITISTAVLTVALLTSALIIALV